MSFAVLGWNHDKIWYLYLWKDNKEKVPTMPDEEYLNESLRKIAKGAGFALIGTLIGRAFGYGSRLIIASYTLYYT